MLLTKFLVRNHNYLVECKLRENILLIVFRFCSECKSKVLKAYSILAGDIDGDSEKG